MRSLLLVPLLMACGDDGGANKLPDAPPAPDAMIDAAPDAEIDAPPIDAPVSITTMSSFAVTNACGLAFDPAVNEVIVYTCSAADITRFSTAGANLGTLARPGEAANDVDLDVTSAAFTLNGTNIPAGSNDGAGLAIVDGTNTAWIGTPSGTAFLLTGIPCN
jgi:hypothetical protein